jgi:hypothetical protein
MKMQKTLASFVLVLLIASVIISIGSITPANGSVINGINYNEATSAAINAGMNWTLPQNASAIRLTLWNRFQDQIPTHSFIITAPNPIGVGQKCNVVMFNPQLPPGASMSNDVRYFFTLTVTKPDGTVQHFPSNDQHTYSAWSQNTIQTYMGQTVFGSDTTGSTYMTYTPDVTGNYTFMVNCLPVAMRWNYSSTVDYYGTTFLASNFTTTLTVQTDPVSLSGMTTPANEPIPTEYWTRPIEQQNPQWYAIASNWLHANHDYNNGGYQNMYQPDGTAPNTGHILWTRPTEDSGIIGGSDTTRAGNSFNTGSQYQPRFTSPIIMYGRLYYSPNLYTSGASEMLDCVDLKTGQLLYEVNTTAAYNPAASSGQVLGQSSTANVPSFGYYYSQDDPNEHGMQNPGWLFTNNYGLGYQPERGVPQLHIANVPSSQSGAGGISEFTGPAGENLRYIFQKDALGRWYLAQWNSSKVIPMMMSGQSVTSLTIEGNVPITPAKPTGSYYWNGNSWVAGNPASAGIAVTVGLAGAAGGPSYDWNVSLPLSFATQPYVEGASLSQGYVFGWNITGGWPTGTGGPSYAYPEEVTVWAISIKPETAGQVLYMKNIKTDDAATNTNYMIEHVDVDSGVFVTMSVPDMQFSIYSTATGDLIGKTDVQSTSINAFGYYTWPSLISMTQTKTAYGLLYVGGYSGTVSAYYLNNASLAWRYEVIPPGNAGEIKSSPGMLTLLADGKLYVGCHEHSAETPLEPGNMMKVLNATTGQLISQWPAWVYPLSAAVADGVLIYWNDYDAQVYAIGQGATQMTVNAPNSGVTVDQPIVIRGSVIDVSAGSQQEAVKANYANGLPVASDASMSEWMAHVYMQKSMPSNFTGVTVTVAVIDQNGNYRTIGTTTTDSTGMYSVSWKPDIAGDYKVIATFAGSASYYGTYSTTSFAAGEAAATTQPTAQPINNDNTQMYVLGIGAAIIVVIAVVAAVLLMAIKKRP